MGAKYDVNSKNRSIIWTNSYELNANVGGFLYLNHEYRTLEKSQGSLKN